MPSEYVQFNYPRYNAWYNDLYLAHECELGKQLTNLDLYDDFGR